MLPPKSGTQKGDLGPELSPTQHARRRQAQTLYYSRQARMPPEHRPRDSPRSVLPGKEQNIRPDKLQSMRVCVEKPETHPNDFRYLFRVLNNTGQPEFIWLDRDGEAPEKRVYDTLFSAITTMASRGWEDASW